MEWRNWRSALLVPLGVFIVACSATAPLDRALFDRLKDRGPVALDPANPYVAANLYLAKQSEQSVELKGFLSVAGTPAAIELSTQAFAATMLQLYYPSERRYYSLEQRSGTWIISGPRAIPDEICKGLAPEAQNAAVRAPVLEAPPPEPPLVETITPPEPIRRSPAARPVKKFVAPAASDKTAAERHTARSRTVVAVIDSQSNVPFQSPAPRPPRPQLFDGADSSTIMGSLSPKALPQIGPDDKTLDALVAKYAGHPAELSPKGDLVHYVTSSAETLALLSRWYTRDSLNVDRIARINGMRPAAALSPGDTLIIPAYLLKNTARLTDDALGEMTQPVRRPAA